MLRSGSLCTGYGGIEMAVHAVFGTGRPHWVADNDPGVCKILEARYPGIPNLGDITLTDWHDVDPVDILSTGFPCTNLSSAGDRTGLDGKQSGVWAYAFRGIAALRPRRVIIENVRGICSAKANSELEYCPACMGDRPDRVVRALGAVLGDLAGIGYDAEWCGVRASDIGACHRRERIVILAWSAAGDTAGESGGERRLAAA